MRWTKCEFVLRSAAQRFFRLHQRTWAEASTSSMQYLRELIDLAQKYESLLLCVGILNFRLLYFQLNCATISTIRNECGVRAGSKSTFVAFYSTRTYWARRNLGARKRTDWKVWQGELWEIFSRFYSQKSNNACQLDGRPSFCTDGCGDNAVNYLRVLYALIVDESSHRRCRRDVDVWWGGSYDYDKWYKHKQWVRWSSTCLRDAFLRESIFAVLSPTFSRRHSVALEIAPVVLIAIELTMAKDALRLEQCWMCVC